MLMEVLKNFYLKGYMKETVSDFEHLEKFIQCKLLRLVLLCIVCLQSGAVMGDGDAPTTLVLTLVDELKNTI